MLRIFDELYGRVADFGKPERADLGSHTYGYSHVVVYEYRGEGDGKERRLLHSIVIVVDEIHRVPVNILKKLSGNFVELDLRVS